MDRQGMDAACKLGRKNLIDHAMTFDPALSAERGRHDMYPEMSLATGSVSRMAFMVVRLVLDVEALWRQRGGELFGDPVFDLHENLRKGAPGSGQRGESEALSDAALKTSLGKTICQDLKVSAAFPHNVRS
jgi:hypothetical protein